jgi:hypothetical protein
MVFSVESVQSAYNRSECSDRISSRAVTSQSSAGGVSPEAEVLVPVLRSVARRRLVKTDNPSACATVNCKLYKSAIALYLRVIKRTCNRGANKSNHPN